MNDSLNTADRFCLYVGLSLFVLAIFLRPAEAGILYPMVHGIAYYFIGIFVAKWLK